MIKKSMASKVLEYSKSSKFYRTQQKDFFESNEGLLKKAIEENQLYKNQQNRVCCKICMQELSIQTDFHQHNIDYIFCNQCSHLNGKYEDTKSFAESLYEAENGSNYLINFVKDNFLQRTKDIYAPKVDFLLRNHPPPSLPLSQKNYVLDVGCGPGYFVYELLRRDISASGIDIGKMAVEYGNNHIYNHFRKKTLKFVSENSFYEEIIESDADVISAMGVIEHLREPYKFFNAFKKSKSEFLYYSVPMFSFSAILENVFKGVFPRQLSGGHTHLFTESSIKKMNEIIGVKSLAEWRFGTDAMDLYRNVLVSHQLNNSSKKTINYLNNGLLEVIDDIQKIFDEHHFCSEIHVLASKI